MKINMESNRLGRFVGYIITSTVSFLCRSASIKLVFLFVLIFSATTRTCMADDPMPYAYRLSTNEQLQLPRSETFTGALLYKLPIDIPPGRNNLNPDIQLTYNNQHNNSDSIVGVGWEINIPYIKRYNKEGTNSLFDTDIFYSSLDGELVYGGGNMYVPRTENGDFRLYNFSDGVWSVIEKDGKVHKFGNSTSTRQDDPNNSSNVYAWYLEETRDTNDNYIEYSYYKDGGEIYPEIITYTGHNTTPGNITIEFERELRDSVATSSDLGFVKVTKYLISEIRSEIDSDWVLKYELNYSLAKNSSTPLLSSSTKSGKDSEDNVTTLPPEEYSYQSEEKSWDDGNVWNIPQAVCGTGSGYDYGVRFVDLNGDGLQDLIRAHYAGGIPPVTYNLSYLNTGQGWVAASWTIPVLFSVYNHDERGARLVDVNGDGLTDILTSYTQTTGNEKSVYINTGDDFSYDSSWVLPLYNTVDSNDQGVRYGDINGDGLADIVQSHSDGFGGDVEAVYINTGTGWELDSGWDVPVNFVDSHGHDYGTRLVDINNDGLADLINYQSPLSGLTPTTNELYVNTGSGWELHATGTIPTPFTRTGTDQGVRLFDINGDGFVDIVKSYRDSSSVVTKTVYINTGHLTWEEDSSWTIPELFYSDSGDHCTGVDLVDFNGDGITDILKSHTTGTSTNENNERKESLTLISHAGGGKTAVKYEQTTQYTDSSSERINDNLPYIFDTVKSITYDDGLGSYSTTTYSYGGGEYYFNGPFDREFVGFASTTETDPLGNVTKSYFHQGNGSNDELGEYDDHVSKAGKPYRTEKYDDDDNLFELNINTWNRYAINATSSFVKLATTTTLVYDGDNDHRDTAIEYTYDDTTGNLTKKSEYGEVTASSNGSFTDTGTDKRSTDIAYAASTTPYIVGLPKQETLKDYANDVITDTKYYYDNLTYGSVNTGNLTKTERWVQGSEWIDTESTYNSYGFVTEEKDPRDMVTSYTYDTYDMYPATSTNAEGITTAYTYDYSSGKITQKIDPNEFVYQTIYDGLDRVIEEKQPDIETPGTLVTKTTYEYTDTKSETKVKQRNYLDATNIVDTYQYFDGLGRLIQTRTEVEESNTYVVIDRIYNERGELEVESLPYFGSGSASTSPTTNTSLLVYHTYDPLGRILATTNTVGMTSYAYDQWETVVTDTEGNPKDLHHDAFNRLVEVEEHNGASTYSTEYEYNTLKNLTKIIDALSNVRNFTYDGLGRQLTAEDLHDTSDGSFGTWTYTYDEAGNKTTVVDPKSQTINYTYDDINRVLTENYTGEAGTEVTYEYDNCTDGKGKLCAATTTDAINTYTYNALGLIDIEGIIVNGTNYETEHEYDRQGNVTYITYPDGGVAKYIYDSGGKIESIQKKENGELSFSDVISDVEYGPHGKITYKKMANGTESTYIYDANELYRLRNIVTGLSFGMESMMSSVLNNNVLADEIIADFEESLNGTTTLTDILTFIPEFESTTTATTTDNTGIESPTITEDENTNDITESATTTTSTTTTTTTALTSSSTTPIVEDALDEGIEDATTTTTLTEDESDISSVDLSISDPLPALTFFTPANEILSKRTYNSRTFDEGDGTYRLETHVGHIFYKDDQGNFQPSDIRFEDERNSWSMTKNNYNLFVAKSFTDPKLIRYDNKYEGARHSIIYKPESLAWYNSATGDIQIFREAQKVQGTRVNDNIIRYTDAFGEGIDFEVTLYRSGFKKEIVIRDNLDTPPTSPSPDYKLYALFKYAGKNIDVKKKTGVTWDKKTTFSALDGFTLSESENPLASSFIRPAYAVDSAIEDPLLINLDVTWFAKDNSLWQAKEIPLEKLGQATYPVRLDTMTSYYAGGGDGVIYSQGNTTWANVRNVGASVNYTGTQSECRIYYISGSTYSGMSRSYFPFDTSGLSGATINSATVYIYIANKIKSGTPGWDGATNLTTVNRASETTLSTSDYAIANHGGTKLSNTSIPYASKTIGAYEYYTLNASGTAAINKTGYTSLAYRQDRDIDNSAPTGTAYSYLIPMPATSESAGTNQDPYLEVVYTRPPEVPTELLVDGLTNPENLSIDQNPNFSAIYNDDIGDVANKYRLQVSTSSDDWTSLMWDSATTSMASTSEGQRSPDIAYAGTPLTLSTTYYWRIAFVDQDEIASPWSTSTATFRFTSFATPTAPTDLLTEGQVNPRIVLDTTPEFSAIFNDTDEDSFATYYQIQVSTSSSIWDTPVWDSDMIALQASTTAGNRSEEISYSGDALTTSTTYYWRIKFWDNTALEGAWSTATSSFAISDTGILQVISFTYDSIGNIIEIVDESGNSSAKTVVYTYDDLSRLISASSTQAVTNDYVRNYTYNSIGNITSASDLGTYTYAGTGYANPHAVTSIASSTYAYDNNGNLITGNDLTNTWDYGNKLTKTVYNGTTTHYGYDHTGQRVFKGDGNATTTYASKYFDVSSDGTVTKHIYAGDELIATVELDGVSTSTNYIHTDHLGGTNVVTDEEGNIVQALDYYPFGGIRTNEQYTEFDEGRKFTGHEWDDDIGMYYMGARYQNPEVGRFVSQDPAYLAVGSPAQKNITGIALNDYLADPQSMNSYSYAKNNPLRLLDPLGLFSLESGKIESGDTLKDITSTINQEFGTSYSIQQLATLNNISDPDKIYVGNTIIPNTGVPDVTNDLTSRMHQNANDKSIRNPWYFKSKVENGGDWDFKNQPGVYCSNQSCGGQEHTSYVFRGQEIRYDAPGNIHYGYVGSNTWYGTPSVLHHFAGSAQNQDNNTNMGDDPSDSAYINYGIRLFNSGY